MKGLVFFLLLVVLCRAAEYNGICKSDWPLTPRPHSVSVLEFGAVGDGKTLNTLAFQNAIFYLKSFADKGGAQLYVPAGKWLIGTINLTSYLTLFLEKDAIILGSQTESEVDARAHPTFPFAALLLSVPAIAKMATRTSPSRALTIKSERGGDYNHWDVIDPLPSYGRGIELPGQRYRSLITGRNLTDVVITGNNATIDGQGSVWWEKFSSHSLNYSRPHLVEFISSNNIVISNLTFLNPPAWNIRPAYCSKVLIQNITVHAPPDSPHTSGIVPDSSDYICIENSNISLGYDSVVLKSGWDEYGIAYGKPTTNVHIRGLRLQSYSGSGMAFGSEMSGGISSILVENLHVLDSLIGIELKTARGRGGYIEGIYISDVFLENVQQGIKATGQWDTHPDDQFDPLALPMVSEITFTDITGINITTSGYFSGIKESPFTSICLSNVSFSITSDSSSSWVCSNVSGSSKNVTPEPCPELQSSISNFSSQCSFLSYPSSQVAYS